MQSKIRNYVDGALRTSLLQVIPAPTSRGETMKCTSPLLCQCLNGINCIINIGNHPLAPASGGHCIE